MIKRPLCTACLLFLAIQAVRVFGLKSAGDLQPSALENAVSEGTRVSLTGTVCKKEEKEKVTAVFLKDNAVFVREDHINESKLLVYVEQSSDWETIKIGNRVRVEGEVSLFGPARNPGNFDQKSYYQRQGIHVLVWADGLTVVSSRTDRLKEEALSRNIDIVMYGHTHRPEIDIDAKVTVLNPGSLSYPRQDGRHPSFMIMEIDRFGEAHYTTNFL